MGVMVDIESTSQLEYRSFQDLSSFSDMRLLPSQDPQVQMIVWV